MEKALEVGGKLMQKPMGRKQMVAVANENQEILTEEQELIKRIQIYYEKLYHGQPYGTDDKIDKWDPEKEAILLEEVEDAVRSLKYKKAGGLNGITGEIIKAYGKTINNILLKIFK